MVQTIRIGITAEDIMEEDFPFMNVGNNVMQCIHGLNEEHEGCVVFNHNQLYGVLSRKDIIKGLLEGSNLNEVREFIENRDFDFVAPNADISEVVKKMSHKNINFLVVRVPGKILGIITKHQLASLSSTIFDYIERDKSQEFEENSLAKTV